MMRKSKWLRLGVLTSGCLFVQACLGGFWQGLTLGWPTDNRWLNIAWDVLKEATVYQP